MSKSAIEWTEETWNPIVGCSIVSPGCTNCYAMKMASRIEAMGNQSRYAGTTRKVNGNPIWTGKLAMAPGSTLLAPLRRKKPTTYFVNSMGDLFHEDCPDEWIDRVFAVMALCPQHTFQVLTKRAARMREYFENLDRSDMLPKRVADPAIRLLRSDDPRYLSWNYPAWPLPNVWLGVSTERQQEADERIPLLLQTPAAVRFISAEPLLGPINLDRIHEGFDTPEGARVDMWESCLNGKRYDVWAGDDEDPMQPGHPKLDWVIVGGESGPDARPMHPAWARSLRDQCAAANVPFFFKQWGHWREPIADEDYDTSKGRAGSPPAFIVSRDGTVHCFGRNGDDDRPVMVGVGKKAAGRKLDGAEHNAMPGRPA